MSKELTTSMVIGKDIEWKELHDYNRTGLLRVSNFTRFATVEGNTVKAKSSVLPYGVLTVLCLEMDSELTHYVTHRIDFFHLSKAFDWCNDPIAQEKAWVEREVTFKRGLARGLSSTKSEPSFRDWYLEFWDTREFEVLVGDFSRERENRQHGPAKWLFRLSTPWIPRLFVWVCPSGYLQRVVNNDWSGLHGWECSQVRGPLARWEPQI